MGASTAAVDLIWIPLGAGGHVVALNGRAYEAIVACIQRRPPRRLFHSALEVRVDGKRWVIEMTPVRDRSGERRGVVASGAVGTRCAARLRIFRYEIRRWRDGVIPDVAEAVGPRVRLTSDPYRARWLLDLVPQVPTPVWGRDELATGDMWNSNSVVSWLIVRTGIDLASIEPPSGGRAPGWQAGVVVARRLQQADPAIRGVARRGPGYRATCDGS
jgi:hypothetical protein